MPTIGFVLFLALGLLQTAAIIGGLEDWVGLHWVIAVPLALLLAYIPIVGTVVGMFGAVTAWHWSWLQAFLLFFGPMLAAGLFAFGATIFTRNR